MNTRKNLALVTVMLGMMMVPGGAEAQRKSQLGTVMQQVSDSLTITVAYSRPLAKGRELYGGTLKWEKVWTPGANKATTVEFSHEVTVAGVAVPAGIYTMWFVPRESSAWSFVLNTVAETWHFRYPGEDNDFARMDVSPEDADYMEALVFYFPVVSDTGATMAFHWGDQRVLIPIEVAW